MRDYDLNTFLIRADPLGDTEALPPGRSVWMVAGDLARKFLLAELTELTEELEELPPPRN